MFLFGVFAVPHATAGQFHPQNEPKISTGLAHFLFGVFAVPHGTAGQFHSQHVPKLSTGLSPICCLAFCGSAAHRMSLSAPKCASPICWAFLRFRRRPHAIFSSKMFLKSAHDYRNFCVWRFCCSAADRMSVSAPKCV